MMPVAGEIRWGDWAPRAPRRSWEVRDAEGRLVAVHERVDEPTGKRYVWRRPDGTPGLGGIRAADLPLYGVERLREVRLDQPVVVCEGERATDALLQRGIAAVGTVTGANGTPSDDVLRVLVGRPVILWPDADDPGRRHIARIATRLHALGASEIRIVEWREAPEGGDAADTGDPAALVAAARPWTPSAADEPPAIPDRLAQPAASAPRRSQASELVDLALTRGAELWHTPAGEAYATTERDGHRAHYSIRQFVRGDLARAYYRRHGHAARSGALTDATETLRAIALVEGREHDVYVRIAGRDGAVYVDLGDPEWHVLAIDGDGWRIIADAPVRFRRPPSLRPLPRPTRGGTLEDLRALWPQIRETDWTLIVSWLVAATQPTGPYPVLVEVGEAGAGKSTLAAMLRNLLDPAGLTLRGMPQDERDLLIGAREAHVLAFDNFSALAPWLSDALCRIATGGGIGARTLYTDLDETIIEVMRPILITGIESPAVRGDLLDRALVVTLPAIADRARCPDTDLMHRYEALRPALLGAVADAVACALGRRSTVRLPHLPRMADACLWVTAAEPALGWRPRRTLAAWTEARETAAVDIIADDPVAQVLLPWLQPGDAWHGTASELLEALTREAPETLQRRREWPRSPRALAGRLRRLAPDLRRVGVEVAEPRRVGHERSRVVEIVRTVRTVRRGADLPEQAEVRPSGPADDAADDADGRPSARVRPSAGGACANSLMGNELARRADDADDADGWSPTLCDGAK